MATKKKKIIMEQNKALIIFCVGFIICIGVVGLFFYFPINSNSNKNDDKVIVSDDGIVDDLGGIRGEK